MKRIFEIVERFKPKGLILVSDADLNAADVPERVRRYRQAALDRQAGRAEIADLIARTERAIARQAQEER